MYNIKKHQTREIKQKLYWLYLSRCMVVVTETPKVFFKLNPCRVRNFTNLNSKFGLIYCSFKLFE